MSPFNRMKACRYGQMIYNFNDVYVGRSFELYGEFSEGEVQLFRQMVQPGDIVADIGANIGAHTLFFAQAVGPTGAVFAFEPQRVVFQTLCGNMAINSIPNAVCYHAALGEGPGQILVPPLDYSRMNNFGGLGLGGFQRGERVQVITLDSLELPRCKLLKIDVEGMEEQVLRGCVRTIERLRPILYVENDRKEKSGSVIRYIDSLDYQMFWHNPRLYNPDNFLKNTENVFGEIVSLNMLCLHKSSPTKLSGFSRVEVPEADPTAATVSGPGSTRVAGGR